MPTKVLIIAPHVDDELIGCYSIIRKGWGAAVNMAVPDYKVSVLWCNELTNVRRREALDFAEHLHVTPYFGEQNALPLSEYNEIYVPSIQDWHDDHKAVNRGWRHFATHFYSVDMKRGVYLGEEASKDKRRLLDSFYLSQSSLWQNDAKYYLFEDIRQQDFNIYEWHTVHYGAGVCVKCTDEDWNRLEMQDVRARYAEKVGGFTVRERVAKFYSYLLEVCKDKVEMRWGDIQYTTE
ncbi:hypothetical protein [Burkholderia phage BCSR5]|nr:hypothetical protein [Burkholderia phage BCSR5]